MIVAGQPVTLGDLITAGKLWWVDATIVAAALLIALPALKRREPRAAIAAAQPAAVTT